MIDAIIDLLTFIVTRPWELIVNILNWLEAFITASLPAAIWSILPEGLAEFLSTIDLDALESLVQTATWFIPIWTILGTYFVAYSLAAVIRLIRYIIGFIPTIEG